MESHPHGASRTEETVNGVAQTEGSTNHQSGTSEAQAPAQVQRQAHALGQPADDRNRTALMAFFVFAVSGLVYAISPVIINFDSFPALPTAISIVNRHTLSLNAYRNIPLIANNYGIGSFHGKLLTVYPWPVSIFLVPTAFVLDVYHKFGGPSADSVLVSNGKTNTLVLIWSASIVTALACTVLALLAYRRLRGSARTRRCLAVVCALVFAFGTSAWSTASRSMWQDGPSMLLLGLGLLALDRMFPVATYEPSPRRGLTGFGAGLCLMSAVAVRPTNAVPLGVVALLLLWKARKALAGYVVGALVIAVPWVTITHAYYGTLLQPYDSANRLTLSSTFGEALAANLVSPARGLLIFSPVVLTAGAGVIVAIRRKSLGSLELLSVVVAPLYLVVSSLWAVWWAGSSYGPRFMSESLPFLFLLALPLVDWLRQSHQAQPSTRRWFYPFLAGLVGLLILASVAFNAEGGLMRSSTCWNGKEGTALNVDRRASRVWSWSDAQVRLQLPCAGNEGLHAFTSCPASP